LIVGVEVDKRPAVLEEGMDIVILRMILQMMEQISLCLQCMIMLLGHQIQLLYQMVTVKRLRGPQSKDLIPHEIKEVGSYRSQLLLSAHNEEEEGSMARLLK
jgi:hypothetical protein